MPTADQSPLLSILVVDDEESVRETLVWMLEDAGHEVFEAEGALAALDFLHGHGPVDIVLSDINMPDMDGTELALRVRAQWPEMPVLLISGRPPPSGVRPFIPKPFRWETLTRAIQAARPWAGA